MKVLVTGGAGFIGSHIVEHFQGRAEVRVLDNLRSGFKHNICPQQHELIKASILDRDTLRKAMAGVDYVFHLAAMVSVPESMAKPLECNEINTTGTLMVLEEATRASVKKLVFSSSAAIYGDNPVVPKVEAMPPEPKSPYAITKLDGECYCKLFNDTGCLATVCLRYFNVFGPRQNPKSEYAAAIPIFIHHALRDEAITIYGDGEQTRDFVYVKDVAAANEYFALRSPATGVFNLAYGKSIAINQLCSMICRSVGSSSTLAHAPERPGDVKHSMAAVDQLLQAGFVPSHSLQDGLGETIKYYQRQLRQPTLNFQ